jgi:hypothetical protein
MKSANLILLASLSVLWSLGAHAFAQTTSQNSSSTVPAAQPTQPASQAAPTAPVQPVAKKVWTNDDLSGLRDSSGAPAVALPRPKPAATTSKLPPAKPKEASSYRTQIANLQAQIPPLDGQIAELQAALRGETVDSTRKYAGVKLDSWSVQLDDLQRKRDVILAKIVALQDEARHSGIPANQIQ